MFFVEFILIDGIIKIKFILIKSIRIYLCHDYFAMNLKDTFLNGFKIRPDENFGAGMQLRKKFSE